MWTLLILSVLAVTLLFSMQPLRFKWISLPVLQFFRKALLPLSRTEQKLMQVIYGGKEICFRVIPTGISCILSEKSAHRRRTGFY